MTRSQKRKNTAPSSSSSSSSSLRPSKRQRRPPAVFGQGVDPPAPSTPLSTVRRPQHSRDCTPPQGAQNRASPSPLFEPEASQLATDAYAVEIPGEDDDEEEPIDAAADDEAADDDEQVTMRCELLRPLKKVLVGSQLPLQETHLVLLLLLLLLLPQPLNRASSNSVRSRKTKLSTRSHICTSGGALVGVQWRRM